MNADPWSWTVNDLVAELCHSPSLFEIAGCRVENFPDVAVLEDQLRDQEVTGATFLTALDSNALRTELGIQNLGQRLALVAVIDLLRGRSIAYKQHTATAGVKALNLDNVHAPVAVASSTTAASSTTTTDANGRKRQKITHVTTLLPSSRPQPPSVPSALASVPVGQPIVDGSGDWDYLLRWEKAGQQVIDIEDLTTDKDLEDEEMNDAGEIPEEDPQEVVDEVEEVEAVAGRSKLSVDQIVEVINERIEHYTNTWTPNKEASKGEEIDYDPEQMWGKAEADGERQALVKKYKTDFAYYEQRLDKLCKEIQDYAGNNLDSVRRQCGVLEVTIDSMLLAEWLLSIYELDPVDDSEEEGEQVHNRSPSIERGSPRPVSRPALPAPRTPPPPEIIDLGSPSDSSDSSREQPDATNMDSSPPHQAHSEERGSSSPDRFHTPDSVIADTVEPPPEKPFQAPHPTTLGLRVRPQQQYGDEPHKASIASARRWRWADLIAEQDRKRVVTKALAEMGSDDRETIRLRLRTVGKADMIREIPACLRMLARKETKLQGVLARDMPKIVTFTRLFLCWWLCDNYFRVEPAKWHLEELGQCLEDGSPDPSTFCDYLNTIMTTTFSAEALRHPEQPSQSEIIDISSDDDEPAPKPATQRKIKVQRPQSSQHPSTIVLD